jgi:hypothetical protein
MDFRIRRIESPVLPECGNGGNADDDDQQNNARPLEDFAEHADMVWLFKACWGREISHTQAGGTDKYKKFGGNRAIVNRKCPVSLCPCDLCVKSE